VRWHILAASSTACYDSIRAYHGADVQAIVSSLFSSGSSSSSLMKQQLIGQLLDELRM